MERLEAHHFTMQSDEKTLVSWILVCSICWEYASPPEMVYLLDLVLLRGGFRISHQANQSHLCCSTASR